MVRLVKYKVEKLQCQAQILLINHIKDAWSFGNSNVGGNELRRETLLINHIKDAWSFGIVMWEVMSYGERPTY